MPRTEEQKAKNAQYMREYRRKYPEKVKASKQQYYKTDKGIKQRRIHGWRCQGVISDDWDKTHEYYETTTNCECCNKLLDNSLTKHLDHNHNITDKPNIRNVLCCRCNTIRGYIDNDYQIMMKLMSMKSTF